jgi:hypothetical protein
MHGFSLPENSLIVTNAVQALLPCSPPVCFADLAPLTSPHATAAQYYPPDDGQWQIDSCGNGHFAILLNEPVPGD